MFVCFALSQQQDLERRMMGVSHLPAMNMGLAPALNRTSVVSGRFVSSRKLKVRGRAEGRWWVFVPQNDLPAGLAAGAELQQANIWAEPLAVLSIFSLFLSVWRLGPLPKNSGMKQKLFLRIVRNGMIGIISYCGRDGG